MTQRLFRCEVAIRTRARIERADVDGQAFEIAARRREAVDPRAARPDRDPIAFEPTVIDVARVKLGERARERVPERRDLAWRHLGKWLGVVEHERGAGRGLRDIDDARNDRVVEALEDVALACNRID